jgi:hypothetical protein
MGIARGFALRRKQGETAMPAMLGLLKQAQAMQAKM